MGVNLTKIQIKDIHSIKDRNELYDEFVMPHGIEL